MMLGVASVCAEREIEARQKRAERYNSLMMQPGLSAASFGGR
jgi:hypothetical protein